MHHYAKVMRKKRMFRIDHYDYKELIGSLTKEGYDKLEKAFDEDLTNQSVMASEAQYIIYYRTGLKVSTLCANNLQQHFRKLRKS